jgi:hypothetical protein
MTMLMQRSTGAGDVNAGRSGGYLRLQTPEPKFGRR